MTDTLNRRIGAITTCEDRDCGYHCRGVHPAEAVDILAVADAEVDMEAAENALTDWLVSIERRQIEGGGRSVPYPAREIVETARRIVSTALGRGE